MTPDLDYEDMLLSGFESAGLRKENDKLRRRVSELETQLIVAKVEPAARRSETQKERADRFERLYETTLARNVILARKVKELGG